MTTRRDALRFLAQGVPAAAVAVCASNAEAKTRYVPPAGRPEDGKGEIPRLGMLYDATRCIGCQACVVACTRANGLEPDTARGNGLWQMPADLNSRTKNIIKLYEEPGKASSFVKRQCMHCADPACVAGCPFGALKKQANGAVTWNGELCIGCRYCEVACPFEIPKFEWDHFNPKIVKCELCDHRLAKGQEPACTDVCPTGAVIFGKRDDLMLEAHRRLDESPGRYTEDRVYGEKEAGGTHVLYLAAVPFQKLGLPSLEETTHPAKELRVQHRLYAFLAIPTLLYGVIAGAVRRNWKKHDEEIVREKAEGLEEQL